MGIAGALIGGASLIGSALLGKKSSDKAAASVSNQNAANVATHTMTPEEKAQYFSGGVTKVNDATMSSQGLLDQNLAARGLGGNAVVAPNANLQRSRIKSIADIWNQLTQTAMNMRTGTPPANAVPPTQSFAQTLFQPIANAGSSVTGALLGNKLGAMFG